MGEMNRGQPTGHDQILLPFSSFHQIHSKYLTFKQSSYFPHTLNFGFSLAVPYNHKLFDDILIY